MQEHNVERIKADTYRNFRLQQLEDKLVRSEELVRQQAETIEQLGEKNRLLQNTVKMGQEELNNAYKRWAEYADKEYMKRLGDSPVISGELIDVTT